MTPEEVKAARALLESGTMTRGEIAEALKVTKQTIYTYFPVKTEQEKACNTELKKHIVELRKQGMTYEEIANLTGGSRTYIYDVCNAYGLGGSRKTLPSSRDRESLCNRIDSMEKERLERRRRRRENVTYEDGIWFTNFWKRTAG